MERDRRLPEHGIPPEPPTVDSAHAAAAAALPSPRTDVGTIPGFFASAERAPSTSGIFERGSGSSGGVVERTGSTSLYTPRWARGAAGAPVPPSAMASAAAAATAAASASASAAAAAAAAAAVPGSDPTTPSGPLTAPLDVSFTSTNPPTPLGLQQGFPGFRPRDPEHDRRNLSMEMPEPPPRRRTRPVSSAIYPRPHPVVSPGDGAAHRGMGSDLSGDARLWSPSQHLQRGRMPEAAFPSYRPGDSGILRGGRRPGGPMSGQFPGPGMGKSGMIGQSGLIGQSGMFPPPSAIPQSGSWGGTAPNTPSIPKSNIVQKSMIMCMDPTCNKCPPEMHALRNRKLMAAAIDEFPQPLASKDGRGGGRRGSDGAGDGGGDGGGRGGGGLDDFEYDFDEFDFEDDEEYDEETGGKRTIIRCCGLPCFVFTSRGKRRSPMLGFFRFVEGLVQPVGILNPHSRFVAQWNKWFMVTCIFGFCIDPWFLFTLLTMFSPSKVTLCLDINYPAAITLTVMRSIVDLMYLINIFIQFRMAYFAPAPSNRSYRWSCLRWWYAETSQLEPGDMETDTRVIAMRYLKSWFLVDLVSTFPIPQIFILGIVPALGKSVATAANTWIAVLTLLALCIQNVPRAARFFPLLAGTAPHVTGFVFETAWANFLLNLVFYLMASNFVGGVWYILAVDRFSECLQNVCANTKGCNPTYLYCANTNAPVTTVASADLFSPQYSNTNVTTCLYTPGDDKTTQSPIPYGVFANAIPLTASRDVVSNYLYSFFWGLQQVSTLCGNLVPSRWDVEVLFVIVVTIIGLLLLALLIGNISNYLQSLNRRSFEYQLQRHDIDSWMQRRNLPVDLQKQVQAQLRLQWAATRGVDEAELLDSFSDSIQIDLRRSLCLELLQCSKLFCAMEPPVLDAFCARLQQQIYTAGSMIIREGYPVSRIFFVLRGELESFSTFGGHTGMVDTVVLGKGDFLGEELLVECLERLSSASGKGSGRSLTMRRSISATPSLTSSANLSQPSVDVLPTAQRSVRCLGPVEGYSLEAADVASVCKQFARMLCTNTIQRALNEICYNRRTHAARTIQLAFRRYLRRKLGLSVEDVFKAVRNRRMAAVLNKAQEIRANSALNGTAAAAAALAVAAAGSASVAASGRSSDSEKARGEEEKGEKGEGKVRFAVDKGDSGRDKKSE
ncbi:unnamed protein product [Closterium sp. NIES-65]|nr:unnamed protein product [Closterium sp. NIES-65]CAI5975964.1 unnamed protein product [Closterium sp. NIES-65]